MAVAGAPHEGAESFVQTEMAVEMDPRLQRVVARRSRGILAEATASSGVDEVPVVAKVSDAEAWAALSEVRNGATISAAAEAGGGGAGRGGAIVTGRIPAARIEAVRARPFVESLKAARPLQPALSAGVEETGARPDLLPPGTLSGGGRGVVVGVVDYGCDFAHRNFLTAAGRTRLLSIWHQGAAARPGSPFGYGREYAPAEINAALRQPDPYRALGYGPAPDTPTSIGSHGTHVLDICAGNGGGSEAPGFAPEAELVFVDVSHSDIPFTGPQVVGSSFGDSTQLLEAVRYVFDKAGDRPCVVNISLGTNGGPHDGSTLVEEGIDRMLAEAPNRAVTIAASNSFDDGIHAQGKVPRGGTVELAWRVPAGDASHNEFELWYRGEDRISVEVVDPAGRSLGTIGPGENGTASSGGAVQVFAASRLADPNNGDNMIGVFLENTAPAGAWLLRLRGDAVGRGAGAGAFHAWIERDNAMPSSFAPPHDNTNTIVSITSARLSIAVGSYDAHKPQRPLSWFSSAGPTRDGREKPEVSAPGHAVLAAHSRTGDGAVSKSGTSMAAPAVAGAVALVLGEARARGLDLSAEDVRRILVSTARRPPPAGPGWDDRYGHGRMDAAAALAETMDRAPAAGGGPRVASANDNRRRASAKGNGRTSARRKT